MATVTKRDLVNRISNRTGLTQQQAFELLQIFIEEVAASLAQKQNVVLRKFGTFQVKITKPRIGRNPKNPAAEVYIPSRMIVKFKPGKELREEVAQQLRAKPKK